jgi:hypothetical protein
VLAGIRDDILQYENALTAPQSREAISAFIVSGQNRRNWSCFTVSMNRGLFAFTHSQHRAENVKERPSAKSVGWPLSYVRGSVLV